ncbi:MAG TPA: hypothetical protein VK308_00795 [Pyrinomonadaceae bacterium]|nr:hypothetical protein [Pyrinomonadaceae bacterium]
MNLTNGKISIVRERKGKMFYRTSGKGQQSSAENCDSVTGRLVAAEISFRFEPEARRREMLRERLLDILSKLA